MAQRTKRTGKRNRKKNEVRVGFPSPLAAVLCSVAAISFVYLWLCSRCEGLGRDITHLEKEKRAIQGRVLNEECKWSNLKAPRSMEALLKKHRLVMTLPDEAKVVRVRAATALAETEAPRSGRQFAQQQGVVMND